MIENPQPTENCVSRVQTEVSHGFACVLNCTLGFLIVLLVFCIVDRMKRDSFPITLPAQVLPSKTVQKILPLLYKKRNLYTTPSPAIPSTPTDFDFFKLRQGPLLIINCRPTCDAYLDGQYLGVSPCRIAFLTPGVHDLILVGQDFTIRRFTIPLFSGATANFVYRWGKNTATLVLDSR